MISLLLAGALVASTGGPADAQGWVVGWWLQDYDEDGAASDETLQLSSDGVVSLFDKACTKVGEANYFLRDDTVIVVATTKKGRVSILYEMDRTNERLRFTSPRTLNVATYKRVDKCVAATP